VSRYSLRLLAVIDVDGDALDDVARDLAPPPVIEPGRPRVGVASQVLNVFEGRVVLQQVGDGRDPDARKLRVAV
jgi:hypothetical protein